MSRARSSSFLLPAVAGAAATFCGIGLSRFAYVPLFPATVAAGWITGPEGGFVGALNFAGYLAGVAGGRALSRTLGLHRALDGGMACAGLSFLACAFDGGVVWLAVWRFVAGGAGGVLMGLVGPAVQGAVEPGRRGLAGGTVVAGVGVGIVTGSLAVPLLLRFGLPAAWAGLGGGILVLWLLVRRHWPAPAPAGDADAARRPGAGMLYLLYALLGAGIVPHMIYFADLAVRARGFDLGTGARLWLLFGVGGIAGTLLCGRAADTWGARQALRFGAAIQVAALISSLATAPALLAVSGFLGGISALGLSAAALARCRELAGPAAGAVWIRATAAYAAAQAASGFVLAELFRALGSHDALFAAGLGLSVVGLAAAAVLPPDRS